MSANPWRSIPPHRSLGVYTEHGLTPDLLEQFFAEAAAVGCDGVYDPFVGSGVVAVYAQDRCVPFMGADSNPWSLLLVKAKTSRMDWGRIRSWAERVRGEVRSVAPLIPSSRLHEYHDNDVLERLGRLRALIEEAPGEIKPLLLAVHARIANKWSRLRRSPAPRFGRVAPRRGNVYEDFFNALEKAVGELEKRSYCSPVGLFMADSSGWMPRRLCGVITSPPFANNVDYVRHTMLELLWAGIASDSKDLGYLRDMQIPACEAAARSWKPEINKPWIREVASRIEGSRARGFRRFVLQYFYSMERHLALLSEALEWEAWYTIGDSILGGVYIPTHEILARLASEQGFKTEIRVLGERYRRGRRLYLLKLRLH